MSIFIKYHRYITNGALFLPNLWNTFINPTMRINNICIWRIHCTGIDFVFGNHLFYCFFKAKLFNIISKFQKFQWKLFHRKEIWATRTTYMVAAKCLQHSKIHINIIQSHWRTIPNQFISTFDITLVNIDSKMHFYICLLLNILHIPNNTIKRRTTIH